MMRECAPNVQDVGGPETLLFIFTILISKVISNELKNLQAKPEDPSGMVPLGPWLLCRAGLLGSAAGRAGYGARTLITASRQAAGWTVSGVPSSTLPGRVDLLQ